MTPVNTQILCVDDEGHVLTGLQRTLRKQFSLDFATGGADGLRQLEAQGPYAVVMADMRMPEMDGIEFLSRVEARWPDTVRLMLTGNVDQKTAVDALNRGHIFRFLNKPCSPEQLADTLRAALRQYYLITAERELLERTLKGSVRLLTDTLAMTDPAAFGRGQQLCHLIQRFARHLNITQTWHLEVAAMLAPLGYLALPAATLQRHRDGQRLEGPEKDLLIRVPETGAALLENIPRLESVADIVRYQHKNFDGTGYPFDAIAGEAIPVGARILRVLADLVALGNKHVPLSRALDSLRLDEGRYDPKVLEVITLSIEGNPSAEEEHSDHPCAVTLAALHAGHRLAAGIATHDGLLIVPAGTVVTDMHLEKVRNFAQVTGIREPIQVEAERDFCGSTAAPTCE
jgi:response regulator RpfG family c-di-GMP phosphodiesterase